MTLLSSNRFLDLSNKKVRIMLTKTCSVSKILRIKRFLSSVSSQQLGANGPVSEIELKKYIASCGLFNVKESDSLVLEGRVNVNGEVCKNPKELIPTNNNFLVTIDNVKIRYSMFKEAPKIWLVRKRPEELMATSDTKKNRPLMNDRLGKFTEGKFPVYRLDYASEGLCLFTNNGLLSKFLLSQYGPEQIFRARIHGLITKEKLLALYEGVFINNKRQPSILAVTEKAGGTNSWLKLSCKNIENRDIIKCLKQLKLNVSRFVSAQFGPFKLAEIPMANSILESKLSESNRLRFLEFVLNQKYSSSKQNQTQKKK